MIYMISVARCVSNGTCKAEDIPAGVIFVHTTVAGLVSALVVAELATTVPGEAPGAKTLASDLSEASKRITGYIAGGYVLVWIISGLAALIAGSMLYPDAVKTLSDAGTTWLGIAVAAAYSYFGIRP
jgi:predicted metal-binding membrane protein